MAVYGDVMSTESIKMAIQAVIVPISAGFSAQDAKHFNSKTFEYLHFIEGLIKKYEVKK